MTRPDVTLNWDGLFIGRAGISTTGLTVTITLAALLAIFDAWWKGLLALAIIPCVVAESWAMQRAGMPVPTHDKPPELECECTNPTRDWYHSRDGQLRCAQCDGTIGPNRIWLAR